jgi:predicted metalloprotease with PDZ domain
VPWGGGDGMEHRNSTVVAAPVSLRSPGMVLDVLDTVAHEFFHAWNVERIRPATLEPFNFEEANISGELWLAEGFTQYYGALTMVRTGLSSLQECVPGFSRYASAVVNGNGRSFRSAVGMSQMAPFTDAARSVDRTNTANTFISYYTYGAAIALGLDLSLRDRSNGKISLDDYMRAMWRVHGKPGGPQPGLVAKPYTLKDARDRLAEVSGDRAFADTFFDKYVEGRDAIDYAPLFLRAGYVWRKSSPGAAWLGTVALDRSGSATISNLLDWGSPAHTAGLDQGDTIVDLDGRRVTDGTSLQTVLKAHKPGDKIAVSFRRRNGATGTSTITLAENPSMELFAIEKAGGTLTAEQKRFRDEWLGSKSRSAGL